MLLYCFHFGGWQEWIPTGWAAIAGTHVARAAALTGTAMCEEGNLDHFHSLSVLTQRMALSLLKRAGNR